MKGEARPFWPGLSFHRIQAEALAAAIKFHQIQPPLRIEPALHRAVHDLQHQLTGGADDRLVQVSAQHTTLRVPGAHVEVGIKLPVLGGDGPHQRDDLKIPLKAVGMVLPLRRVEHPHCEVPHGAQPADSRQPDTLLLRRPVQLGQHLLAPIDPQHHAAAKTLIFHPSHPFAHRSNSDTADPAPPATGTAP